MASRGTPDRLGEGNLVPKEMQHLLDCILVKDVGVWNLWQSHGMDNEQRRAGLCANPRISVVLKGAQIIEQVTAGFQARRRPLPVARC